MHHRPCRRAREWRRRQRSREQRGERGRPSGGAGSRPWAHPRQRSTRLLSQLAGGGAAGTAAPHGRRHPRAAGGAAHACHLLALAARLVGGAGVPGSPGAGAVGGGAASGRGRCASPPHPTPLPPVFATCMPLRPAASHRTAARPRRLPMPGGTTRCRTAVLTQRPGIASPVHGPHAWA